MTSRLASCLALTGLLTGIAGPASAQSGRTARFTLGLNAGGQALTYSRVDTTMFELFSENGTLESQQRIGGDVVYDAHVGFRLWKWVGLGVAASFLEGRETASLTAAVPSPFFFDFHRTATATVDRLAHRELAIHPQLQIWIPLGSSWRFTFGTGATFFDATQDIVTRVTTREDGLPFDVVNIDSHRVDRISASEAGYNVELDLSYFMTERFGVGVLARYSRATPAFTIDDIYQPALELGGLHLAGGLRLIF